MVKKQKNSVNKPTAVPCLALLSCCSEVELAYSKYWTTAVIYIMASTAQLSVTCWYLVHKTQNTLEPKTAAQKYLNLI